MKFLKNQKGISLVEVVIAAALTSLVVGLSAAPMMQMKKLEKRVEFQTSLDISHQLALQKARNTEYLKTKLGIAPGSPQEKCFSGKGTGCAAYNTPVTPTLPIVESVTTVQPNGYAAKSDIGMAATCGGISCTVVRVSVSTLQTSAAPSEGWQGRPLVATFTVPATALAGRMEIDFNPCLSQIVTGVDYVSLDAKCDPLTGSSTCTGAATLGPLRTFGQAAPSDPANCQPQLDRTCSDGVRSVGLMNSSVACVTAMVPPAPTACPAPVWVPAANTVCNGQAFTQTDANACPTSVPQAAVGTNPALCPAISCTMPASVRWPNPATGPCGVASAAVSAGVGSPGTVINEQMGYHGTFTATCVDGSPGPSNFDMAGATQICNPIVCSAVPTSPDWSAVGAQSAFAGPNLDPFGPYSCNGPMTFSQPLALPAGTLMTVQAAAGANATANNTKVTATSGNITAVCNDPGPVSAPRGGVLSYSAVSCVPAAGPAAPGTCWEAGDIPARQGGPTGPCETITYPGYSGVRFKTQAACTSTAATYPGGSYVYSSTCFPVTNFCIATAVPDVSACSDAFVITGAGPTPTPTPTCVADGVTSTGGHVFNPGYDMTVWQGTGPAEMTGVCCSGLGHAVSPSCPSRSCAAVDSTVICGPSGGPPSTPAPTATPAPATPTPAALCHPDGFETKNGNGGGPDDTPCSDLVGPPTGPAPHDLCCSGWDYPTYGFGETVGGGNCTWKCGSSAGPPPVATPSAPTPRTWKPGIPCGPTPPFAWNCMMMGAPCTQPLGASCPGIPGVCHNPTSYQYCLP